MPPWTAVESVAPGEALARWQAHRERFRETGLWPVIAPLSLLENLEENLRGPESTPQDDLREGTAMDAAALFERRLAENAPGEGEGFEEEDVDFDPSELEASPKPPVFGQIAALNDFARDNAPDGLIGVVLVPCREPWEVPAILGYGGWNDCPPPAEQVAVLREWNRRHGAEPLFVGDDTLELRVRPIDDPQEAKRTAVEQYAYCADVVDQGVGTVAALAAGLLGASVWFFWWD